MVTKLDPGKVYITTNGMQRLREEFFRLKRTERAQVVETVAWAAGNGDRSENGDYIYGKKRLREIDRRIAFLASRFDAAIELNLAREKLTCVHFGATVTIEEEDGTQRTYTIVGEDEVDVSQGRVSWKSPLGRALLYKREGDVVEVKAPKGNRDVEILAISWD